MSFQTETIIEKKVCRHCGMSFSVTNKDAEFLEQLSPIIAGKKVSLSFPTLCPDCRKIQRLAWRNEKNIFKRKCDATGRDIIALFPPDSPLKVYDEKVWNSDIWDAKSYGRDFDFSRSFSDQFYELMLEVPVASKALVLCENSDYCNASTSLKNCYLTFSANASEDVLYTVDVVRSKSSIDCLAVIDSENCYECTVATGCYNVEYSYDVKNCRDSRFLLSCDGCSDCYGCLNLTNAQFHIFNVPYSKNEYSKKLQKLNELSLSDQKKQFEVFYREKYTKLPLPVIGSENVIDSENVFDSKNIYHSRHVR